ncbi:hypothetical protein [Neobacillus vireti]|uniref:DUF5673 domain-containing protein n=1 Tax=Neobacillus vireti LMG 21834 TaxID=1131730 RepID=A0AB94IPB2_9BACI|nr:hypothetical protein [Neobacillus vireti]ETI68945.1 hypothetical protein BAVI_09296 [Neobacillus vireti LMG 21834]
MILTTILFAVIFLSGIYYLIRNLLNLKKAAELSKDALYPMNEVDFAGIIIPNEWKQMEPLTKNTKSYRYVLWGTVAALVVLTVLLVIVLTTNWIDSSYFSLAYLFFAIISSIRHRGNLFILPKGIVLNGKYFTYSQIKNYESEQIIRWHNLYGLDSKVNNAYKLTIHVKRNLFHSNFLVIGNSAQLEQITTLLHQKGVRCKTNPSEQMRGS